MIIKTALITGASRGIGAAAVLEFAERGWNVAIGYKDSEEAARELAKRIGKNAFPIRADVGSDEEAEVMVAAAYGHFGRLDAVVNNAGVACRGLFQDYTMEQYKALFDVNFFGACRVIRAALPHLLRQKSGSIVNVSSVWGRTGASCEVMYSASKAALIGLTKALAKELAPSGIQVNCAAPGVIDTDMNKGFSLEEMDALQGEIPLERLGSPKEAAKLIYFLAAEASYMTGQVVGVDGGLYI